jgi:hypothetical protein
MVKITLDATLSVAAGPTLSVGTTLDPEPDSYTVANLLLAKKDDPAKPNKDKAELALLPEASDVVLLGVRVRDEQGKPAKVKMTPKKGTADGSTVLINGALVIANKDALVVLVTGGPRTLAFVNEGPTAITVDIMAALSRPTP